VLTSKRNEHQLESLPFQTSPSELDYIAPVSVVSSKPTPVLTAAGVSISKFVEDVAPTDELLLEVGCVGERDARLTLTAFADAQQFRDRVPHGRETSKGEVGVYRYREVKSIGTDSFALESLLRDTGYDVHTSKLKLNDHGLVRTGSYWTAVR
jgi:hypothetical protein